MVFDSRGPRPKLQMPRTVLLDGRQVKVENLVVAVLAIIVSFVAMRHWLDGEVLAWSRSSLRVSHAAGVMGVRVALLPHPLGDVSLIVAQPFGVADAAHRVMRFFTSNLETPSAATTRNASGFWSESTVLSHLLSPNYISQSGRAQILHLCSANACVAPYLMQHHVQQARRTVNIAVLVSGDAFIGHLVERDLAKLGVRTPTYPHRSTMEEVAMPLYGIVAEASSKGIVSADCTLTHNRCRYVLHDNATVGLTSVSLKPLNKVYFGVLPLSNTRFDVVHIDVNSDEVLVTIAFLKGVVSASLRPTHIVVVVYFSRLLDELVQVVSALRRQEGYHVFLAGGRCLALSDTSVVSSAELLEKILRQAGSVVLSEVNIRSYAANPICVLFLSQMFRSLPHLQEHVTPVEEGRALDSFLFGYPEEGTRSGTLEGFSMMWNFEGRVCLLLLSVAVVVGFLIFGLTRKLGPRLGGERTKRNWNWRWR